MERSDPSPLIVFPEEPSGSYRAKPTLLLLESQPPRFAIVDIHYERS